MDTDGRLTGLVTLNRVRAVPQGFVRPRLREIACAPDEVPIAQPEDPLVELLERMQGCSDGRAVVVDNAGRVVGVVSPSDVARAMELADFRAIDPYAAPSGADRPLCHRNGAHPVADDDRRSASRSVMAPGRYEVQEFPRPSLIDGAVLMQVEMSGICGTDKHTFLGETKQYAGTPAETTHRSRSSKVTRTLEWSPKSRARPPKRFSSTVAGSR